ncbi:MAG: hypothetical protein IMW95_05370 [Moorella humiferrea]|nr:hypothetical protein [Moorella humiferrea]
MGSYGSRNWRYGVEHGDLKSPGAVTRCFRQHRGVLSKTAKVRGSGERA